MVKWTVLKVYGYLWMPQLNAIQRQQQQCKWWQQNQPKQQHRKHLSTCLHTHTHTHNNHLNILKIHHVSFFLLCTFRLLLLPVSCSASAFIPALLRFCLPELSVLIADVHCVPNQRDNCAITGLASGNLTYKEITVMYRTRLQAPTRKYSYLHWLRCSSSASFQPAVNSVK